MGFFSRNSRKNTTREQKRLTNQKKKFYKKKWFIVALVVLFFAFGVAGFFVYKTGYILNKISDGDSSAINSLFGVIPGMGKQIKEEDDGRINLLLLGMRGVNVPGGGLLADTILVVSFIPEENKMAMISIPRDLYVKVPGTETRSKINAVYAFGEENGKKQGLSQMKKIVGEVTGLNIHYSTAINFTGFKQLVDVVGGIDITLETSFYETTQFVKGNECGGQFVLPKGLNHLDGETALCYVRARENTSDFDRAKRQQVVLQSLKQKLISLGTLTDFGKVNGILNAIGDNVRTDMSASEMKKFYDKYSSVQDPQIFQRVFENSEEGMLMVPRDAPEGAGYILIPRAGWNNYSGMRDICRNIFTIDPQSDINPVKQYYRPVQDSDGKKKDDKKEVSNNAKTVKIKVKGDLSVSSGLEYSEEIKIAKVEVKGDFDNNSIIIDLDDLDKVKKKGTVKVRIEDLDLPKNSKITSHDDRDTVLLVVIIEEQEEVTE